jgi:hypothetical protein
MGARTIITKALLASMLLGNGFAAVCNAACSETAPTVTGGDKGMADHMGHHADVAVANDSEPMMSSGHCRTEARAFEALIVVRHLAASETARAFAVPLLPLAAIPLGIRVAGVGQVLTASPPLPALRI